MVPETVPCLVRSHLESYIRQANRKNPVLERDTWKGKACWRISYLNRYDQPIRIWVVPEWGHAVVQIVHEVPKQGKVWLKSAVETDYKQTKNGVWYPSRCVYQREEWGKPGEGEVCDVEVASINEPLPSKVFKLEGMDLPKGVIVMGPLSKDGETLCWNGQQLVPYAGKKPAPPKPPMSRSGPFYTASILSGLVAALSLVCYLGWRRRSAPGS
ncbi:MAG: hypothetical protein U0797_30765 [Gemmataceae bacterium]